MNRQKLGLTIFILGVLLSVIMGAGASWDVDQTFRDSTMDEVNQTMWKSPGFWFFLWALGTPIGMIIAGVGAMMYAKVKPSKIWLFGIGVTLLALIINMLPQMGLYSPPLFGIAGTLILLSFFGIVWLWMKKRSTLKSKEKLPADLKLVGYTFLGIAMWFLCGLGSMPFLKALEGVVPNPTDEILFLALGWIFLFLGHYKESKIKK
ncbi:hypothetical protein ACFLZZ_00400 [Nanoarchaeota archaeon]